MFSIITFSEDTQWDVFVESFSCYEVYYLHGYVTPFYHNGDGKPILITYNEKDCRAVKVCLVRDLFEIERLRIAPEQYYDLVTPYGYGGFLVEGIYLNRSTKNTLSSAKEISGCF